MSSVMRNIPSVMATQHPDNAQAPYWETDGDGFVSIYEEMDECASSFWIWMLMNLCGTGREIR